MTKPTGQSERADALSDEELEMLRDADADWGDDLNKAPATVSSVVLGDRRKLLHELDRVRAELAEANHWRERHCRDAAAAGQSSAKNWGEAKKLREELAEARRERDEALTANESLASLATGLRTELDDARRAVIDAIEAGARSMKGARLEGWNAAKREAKAICDVEASCAIHGMGSIENCIEAIAKLRPPAGEPSACGYPVGQGHCELRAGHGGSCSEAKEKR